LVNCSKLVSFDQGQRRETIIIGNTFFVLALGFSSN
jgi:hypothetical protein